MSSKESAAIAKRKLSGWLSLTVGILGVALCAYSYVSVRINVPKQVAPVAMSNSRRGADSEPTIPHVAGQPGGFKRHETVPVFRSASYRDYPSKGDRIGTIDFPSLKMSWPIFQGTSNSELAKGVGHYLNSVLPGQIDNSVLAGHRETVFNRLGELSIGDVIITKTDVGTFKYRVRQFRIVKRSDRTVIVPTPSGVLTLATCYPFNYVGITNKSFIVVADLVSSAQSSS